MDEVRRQDWRLFVRELLRTSRLVLIIPVVALMISGYISDRGQGWLYVLAVALGWYGWTAATDSIRKRFHARSFAMMWDGCEDKLTKFEQVLKKLRKEQVADLSEMPQTIRSVAQSVYVALRKADMIAFEIGQTEYSGQAMSPGWTPGSNDPQSQALYRLADRNIAEYRSELAAVMAGVHRAEAQAAVFMTTLDSLRVKMLGYRLVGRRPELPSQDFLESLAEARLQLESIDKALEDLDLGHYPKQISVVQPPPMPADEVRRLEQNQ